MVEVSINDHQTHLNSPIVLLPQTPSSHSERAFESERSYFEDDSRKRRWRTSPTTFWILIALATLVVGGVIGGVTAGVLVTRNGSTAR